MFSNISSLIMSTAQTTVDFILGQLAQLGDVYARKMFGEYALYYNNKVVGLICDDTLFVKITEQGKRYVAEHYEEGQAYPGAKASMIIDESQIEDPNWFCELIRITEAQLPMKKNSIAAAVF
jgi:TfoX/Sxy family transcriptional regulator of competence genes